MTTTISQFLIAFVIVTIFALLWHARRQRFAQIGNSWGYMLVGFACLSSGEIFKLVLPALLKEGHAFTILESELVVGLAYIPILLGLVFIAIGVYRWLSATQDIFVNSTEVNKRNTTLHERVARDGRLLSTVPAALYRTSGSLTDKASKIEFVNDKIEELLGYSRADFAADPALFGSLMHAEDKKRFKVERTEMWYQGAVVLEHRFRHKNGEYRWLRRHLNRLSCDNNEQPEWHACIFDITDLKQAEARLTNFLEAAPDPVITTNDQAEIVLVNAQAERLYGYSKAELIGQSIQMLMPEGERAFHIGMYPEYLEITTSRMIDVGADIFGLHKDGTKFPVEISVSPIESGDEKLLAFAIRDVSERHDMEAQLRQSQKMEAVGQLTGGIAHDFNNMLTVVIGNLQLLEQIARNDEAKSPLLNAAMDASTRAAELVTRLLAFSRQQLLAPANANINELVIGIEPLLRRTITEQLSLKIKPADDLWLARIDPAQLENALMNLAINARDATQSGGRLTIETSNTVLDEHYAAQRDEVTPGEYVMVAVSDNGEGIPKDILPHVFDPFYSTKEIGKGSGLGLSMVYGFVKQSKGHVNVYSEVGHGTTIKIYIPRSKATDRNSAEQTIRTKVVPVGNETILVVEDDNGVRDVATSLLTALGYNVLQAGCGSEALVILDEHMGVDLLFTDIVMPGGISGTELAKLAVANNQNLKVLYTSGYTDTTVFDNCLLDRGNDVLNKPYRKELLAQTVRDVLDRE